VVNTENTCDAGEKDGRRHSLNLARVIPFRESTDEFRRGVNRLAVVVTVLWELLCLLLLSTMHGEGDVTMFVGAMFGGPLLLFGLVRALLWIVEGFKGSSLE
jgi:hypothetical protein